MMRDADPLAINFLKIPTDPENLALPSAYPYMTRPGRAILFRLSQYDWL